MNILQLQQPIGGQFYRLKKKHLMSIISSKYSLAKSIA